MFWKTWHVTIFSVEKETEREETVLEEETEKLILAMLQNINSELVELKRDVKELKEDVATIKKDVAILKEDVAIIKEDMAIIKKDVEIMKEDLRTLLEWTEEVSENDSRFPKIGVTSFRKRTDVVLV